VGPLFRVVRKMEKEEGGVVGVREGVWMFVSSVRPKEVRLIRSSDLQNAEGRMWELPAGPLAEVGLALLLRSANTSNIADTWNDCILSLLFALLSLSLYGF